MFQLARDRNVRSACYDRLCTRDNSKSSPVLRRSFYGGDNWFGTIIWKTRVQREVKDHYVIGSCGQAEAQHQHIPTFSTVVENYTGRPNIGIQDWLSKSSTLKLFNKCIIFFAMCGKLFTWLENNCTPIWFHTFSNFICRK